MKKRGQSAGGAAVLLILIAVVMILYLLFLPPDSRLDILGENSTYNHSINHQNYDPLLLRESVGRLDYLKFDYRDHDLPSFRISADSVGTEFKNMKSIYIRRGVGGEKAYNLSFDITNRLTSNVVLSFNVKDSVGEIEISLNNNVIFSGKLESGTPETLEIPSDYLQDKNILSFSVSSPGLLFWRINRYELENIQLTGDVLDLSNSRARQFFYLSDAEYNNLDELKVKFDPGCTVGNVGTLKVYFNGAEAYSGKGDCGIYQSVHLDVSQAVSGKNELEFIVSDGSYLIDRLSVTTNLKDLVYPVYYFEVDPKIFFDDSADPKELKDRYNVTMTIRFVNDDQKKMEYSINGVRKYINTYDKVYETNLDDWILPDTNSLEIVPTSLINIAELRVVVTDED